jgi:hypothetical protein
MDMISAFPPGPRKDPGWRLWEQVTHKYSPAADSQSRGGFNFATHVPERTRPVASPRVLAVIATLLVQQRLSCDHIVSCRAVMAFKRAAWLGGGHTSVSSTTFLLTLSRAITRRTARSRQARTHPHGCGAGRVASPLPRSWFDRSRAGRAASASVIAHRRGRDPTLTALIPTQAAVTTRTTVIH